MNGCGRRCSALPIEAEAQCSRTHMHTPERVAELPVVRGYFLLGGGWGMLGEHDGSRSKMEW